MKTVTTAEAKNNLSRYLAYVRRGGRVRILDRKTPVAELVPIESTAGSEDEALLAALVQRGLVRPPRPGPLPRDLLRPSPVRCKVDAVGVLLDERKRGR